MLFPVFRQNRWRAAVMTKVALDDLEARISDPLLRKALTPDYPIGGKRILFSDDYYTSLTRDGWKDAPVAYMGMTVAGFPNFFMMYGPNTNLGHNSIIFMIECQANHIVGAIRQIFDQRIGSIDLRADMLESYNDRIQRELATSVWATTDRSWYKNEAGRITNNWSGTTIRYWWMTRRPDLSVYDQVPLGALKRE